MATSLTIEDKGYGIVTFLETTTGDSIDTYVAVQTSDVSSFRTKIIYLKETGAVNGITYKMEASLDGTNYYTIKAETALGAGLTYFLTDTDAWNWIKVSLKATVAESQGEYSVSVKGLNY